MRTLTLIATAALLVACKAPESAAQQRATAPGAVRHDTALAPQFPLHPTHVRRLNAPEGLEIDQYAESNGARFMVQGPDGRVYVSRPGAGEIDYYEDANGDGVPENNGTQLFGLDRPHGMAFFRGAFYVAEGGQLTRFALDANGRPTGKGTRVASYANGGGHWTRTVIVGPDSMLYVSVGSSCNICEGDVPERAAVLRVDPANGMTRPYSIGLRNAVGLAVNPATRQIWVTTHERDNLGDDVPPEEIDILKDGADYGWPYCWGDRQPNPELQSKAHCESTTPPALMMQAHSAPLGITFLRGATQLRSEYQGDALVAFHGSWNRSVPTGAKVVRIRIVDGKPVSYEDFVTGWQDASGNRWGRPVDVLVLRDGSVLISDDTGDAIYRVHR